MTDDVAAAKAALGRAWEVRIKSETGGEKGTKPERYDLIPVGPLAEMARVYHMGASKYEDRNWERGYPWSLSFAAMQRHAWAFWGGEELDPESGYHHLAHAGFHIMTLMEFGEFHRNYDDRSQLGKSAQSVPREDRGEQPPSVLRETRHHVRGGTVYGRSRNPADGPDC